MTVCLCLFLKCGGSGQDSNLRVACQNHHQIRRTVRLSEHGHSATTSCTVFIMTLIYFFICQQENGGSFLWVSQQNIICKKEHKMERPKDRLWGAFGLVSYSVIILTHKHMYTHAVAAASTLIVVSMTWFFSIFPLLRVSLQFLDLKKSVIRSFESKDNRPCHATSPCLTVTQSLKNEHLWLWDLNLLWSMCYFMAAM